MCDRLIEAIDSAESYLLLEMYLVRSGALLERFISAILRARERGVACYLLLDHFGAGGLSSNDQQRLTHAEVELCFYNPMPHRHPGWAAWRVLVEHRTRDLHRNHRKLLLVDGVLAFTGGLGLLDDLIAPPPTGWRETLLEMEGPVVGDWQQLFEETWYQQTNTLLNLPLSHSIPAMGSTRCRLAPSDARGTNRIRQSALVQMRQAEQRIWLSTAYFLPSWPLRRALMHAAHRGVDVRLLVPGDAVDHPAARRAGQRFYRRLLRHGVRIFEYQPSFLHSKTLLCDRWASIGSSNYDRWNLRWNLEANVEIEGQGPIEALTDLFEGDFQQSQEITREGWQRRPWQQRLPVWFWGLVDWGVERILQHRPIDHRRLH